MRHLTWLFVIVMVSGCEPSGPTVYDYKIETITENGETAKVTIWFPGVVNPVYVENYNDMDVVINSTKTALEDMERIRKLMPEGDSQPPPLVVEPEN